LVNVRFSPNTGHRTAVTECPLWAMNGHLLFEAGMGAHLLTGSHCQCSTVAPEEKAMTMKLFATLVAAMLAFSAPANAQKFPNRPIAMVIPFAAGGPTDVLGRVIAGRMSEVLGQQVVVENVTGAGGMTGSARVANAAPDGYQFVLATVGSAAQGQTLYKHPLYNTVTDFTPVILIANIPLVLITRKNLPVSDFGEFVTYAKENQAKMQFGSAGAGSATHLGCVLMNYLIGVNITHVPYRGTGPAMQDLQGGRIDYLCDVITTAKPQIDGSAVKGLAIFDSKRSPALPNVPTAIEQGSPPDLVAYTWNAIFLPKGAPEPIVKTLHDAALAAMHTPAVRERLTDLGAEIVTDDEATPQHLGEYVKSEIAKWAVPIKASGVTVE
jgi:tripartite-type tricarboxylate transporter receptor subunit TctC